MLIFDYGMQVLKDKRLLPIQGSLSFPSIRKNIMRLLAKAVRGYISLRAIALSVFSLESSKPTLIQRGK